MKLQDLRFKQQELRKQAEALIRLGVVPSENKAKYDELVAEIHKIEAQIKELLKV